MPTVKRVPNSAGASGKSGVLHVYSYVKLGTVGTKIVELASYYPKIHELYVTSGMDGDHGKTSHHYGLTYNGSPTAAVDFGARGRVGAVEGARRMRDFGAWLEDKVPGYRNIVELIHTTPYATDDGYYVRHGVKLGSSGFGAATNAAHANHVHLAMSAKQVEAALRKLKATAPKSPAPKPPTTGARPFPLSSGHYYGLITGPKESHGGYYANERGEVKAIQQRLQSLGYAPKTAGWADGRYEAPTVEAVKKFQRDKKLTVDGKVGPKTWAALFPPPAPPKPSAPPGYNTTAKPIFGWDASDFDHDRGMRASRITAAATEGIRFFTHKIAEGTKTVHEHCGEKLTAAVAAGIPFVGAYVVVRTPGNNGHGTIAAQADFAIAELDRQFPAWRTTKGFFWQVDLEHWSYDKVAPQLGVELVNALVAKTGKKALLYAPRWAYGDSIPGGPALWASNYTGSGDPAPFKTQWARTPQAAHAGFQPYSGRTPAVLQYTSDATVGGQKTCDANVFLGAEADFAKLVL